jgi:hypothetical protein
MENSFMFKLEPKQFIYREGAPAAQNLYFILYGNFICYSQSRGHFGAIMAIGHTLGEEILYS